MKRYTRRVIRFTFILAFVWALAGISDAIAGAMNEPPADDDAKATASQPTAQTSQPAAGRARGGSRWDPQALRERGQGAAAGRGRGGISGGRGGMEEGRRYPGSHGGIGRAGQRERMPFFIDRIVPMLETDHPELAERLRKIREESPEEFERLVADALALRFESAFGRVEAGKLADSNPSEPLPGAPPPSEPQLFGPRPPSGWDEPGAPLDPKLLELQRQDVELEQKTLEIAEQFRKLAAEPGSADANRQAELREELQRTIAAHFELRTELRRNELRRIDLELNRLREAVERIQTDLKRREAARATILERRLLQLLGEDEDHTPVP